MPSFILLDNSIDPFTLTDGELGFIGPEGALEVGSDAITATGEVALTVLGRLFGNGAAIRHAGGGELALHLGEDADVDATSDTIVATGIDEARVWNAGRVRSAGDAIDLRGSGSLEIVNSGRISADGAGIVVESDVRSTILNRGLIEGAADGVSALGADTFLANFGTIRGGYAGSSGLDLIGNAGAIAGGVLTRAGEDVVNNRGSIDRVLLGAGADRYEGVGRGVAGRVDTGSGADYLAGSRADDLFVGGTGSDTFTFGEKGGHDRILDFGAGDRIDLFDLGLDGFREVRAATEDVRGGCLIDLSEDHGLTLFLRGVDRADLAASDFLLVT